MVRSTGEIGEDWVECLAREMMEFSMEDFDAMVSAVAAPPRATTDEADAADAVADSAWLVNRSVCLPVLMKNMAENAMAMLRNFCLTCSLLEPLLPRILFEILFTVDLTLPRTFAPLIDMESCVELFWKAGACSKAVDPCCGMKALLLLLLTTDAPSLFCVTDRASAVAANATVAAMATKTRREVIVFIILIPCFFSLVNQTTSWLDSSIVDRI